MDCGRHGTDEPQITGDPATARLKERADHLEQNGLDERNCVFDLQLFGVIGRLYMPELSKFDKSA